MAEAKNISLGRPKLFCLLLLLLIQSVSCKPDSINVTPQPSDLQSSNQPNISFPNTPAINPTPTQLSHVSYKGVELKVPREIFGQPLGQGIRPREAGLSGNGLPERLEIIFSRSFDQFSAQLDVYSVEEFNSISPEAKNQLFKLKNFLSAPVKNSEAPAPFFPMSMGSNFVSIQHEVLDFQNGNGIGNFVQLAHDNNAAANDLLFYSFQGLTDDGKYYVSILIPLEYGSTLGVLNAADIVAADQQAVDANIKDSAQKWKIPIEEAIETMKIVPQLESPALELPSTASLPGVLVSFDPEKTIDVSFTTQPVIVSDPNGSANYLEGIPDLIELLFAPRNPAKATPRLTIQPVREPTGEFFKSIPGWQRQRVIEIEAITGTNSNQFRQVGSFVNDPMTRQILKLQNGLGIRSIDLDQADHQPSYFFEGLTADGRYLVRFSVEGVVGDSLHELLEGESSNNSTDLEQDRVYFDAIIQSLAVHPDVSTQISLPSNSPDCFNSAEFVDDISFPDYTLVKRGATFEKTWRVRNSGNCVWSPTFQILQAGGNPLTWQISKLPGLVSPGDEVNFSVKITAPQSPGIYHAWWQLADEDGAPFGSTFSILFETDKPATDIPGYGVIKGEIRYPAGVTPAMTIYFLSADGAERYALETDKGWTHFVNELPIGNYYVFARLKDDNSQSGGGFTNAVQCEFECDDHSLVEIAIIEGEATDGVDINDWYAPEGTFPLPE